MATRVRMAIPVWPLVGASLLALLLGCGELITEESAETPAQLDSEHYASKWVPAYNRFSSPTFISYVRLKTREMKDKQFLQVDIEAKVDPLVPPLSTVGWVNVDIYYDVEDLTFVSTGTGVLGAGYQLSVSTLEHSGGPYLRVAYTSSGIGEPPSGTPGHDLGKNWELIRRVYFRRTDPKVDPRLTIRLRSLTIGFYDSPDNSNGTSHVVPSVVWVKV